MVEVLLTIFKILGIILLVILGLILLTVATVLFVPIRYRSKGYVEKTDEGIDDKISAKVTWLLHILSVSFELDGKETNLTIKIFGKRLNIGGTEKSDKSSGTESTKQAKLKSDTQKDNSKSQDVVGKEEKTTEKTVTTETVVEKNVTEKMTEEDKLLAETSDKSADEEKKSLKQKISDVLDKIKGIFEKIKHINAIKNSFIEYLKRDESKIAIREIKNIIFGAIRHILPQKFRARAWFGFEDPATTGNILGVLSIFYGIYGKNLDLNPNFQEEVLKFEYELKGRIRLFTLLMAALRIYSNRWIKDFIALSKNAINNTKTQEEKI